MSTFSVGQRVRINWCLGWPELAGTTGVVAGEEQLVDGSPCWTVIPDAWGQGFAPRPGLLNTRRFGARKGTDQIEPLVPDGMAPIEWEDCLWQPEQNEVTVR